MCGIADESSEIFKVVFCAEGFESGVDIAHVVKITFGHKMLASKTGEPIVQCVLLTCAAVMDLWR